MRPRRRDRDLRLLFALLCFAGVAAGCGSSDDPPTGTDGAAGSEAGVADSGPGALDGTTARDSGGSTFEGFVRTACQRIVASCQNQNNALDQPWRASITPWTHEACEKMVHCVADETATKCYERLYGYYLCMAEVAPFSCQACLNQLQYVAGACPCLKSCDPGCP